MTRETINIIALVIGAIIGVWLVVRSIVRSENAVVSIIKWVITLALTAFIVFRLIPMGSAGGEAAFGAAMGSALLSVIYVILWRQSISALFAKPFMSLYDGGGAEYEARPFYSIAQAKIKRGAYPEAIAEIRKQLQRFPNDAEGQLLLARLYAEHMNDLPGAELTIERLLQQEGHPARCVALALNCLADWHLKYAQDRDAARADLQRIIDRLPDSEMSAIAAQRIAHLASNEFMLASHDRKRIALPAGVENIGLLSSEQQPKAPEADSNQVIANYVKHLESHPLDTEVREKLAVLYADYHRRLDLAADQIEQLIEHPNQPAKRVVHWLNLLADLQIKHGQEVETIRETLQRIVDRYPDSAAAEMALKRIDVLKLEVKGQQKGQTIRMGVYEQDIGLKRRPEA